MLEVSLFACRTVTNPQTCPVYEIVSIAAKNAMLITVSVDALPSNRPAQIIGSMLRDSELSLEVKDKAVIPTGWCSPTFRILTPHAFATFKPRFVAWKEKGFCSRCPSPA